MSLSVLKVHFQDEIHALGKGNVNFNFVVPNQGCFL